MITVNGYKLNPTIFPDKTSQVWKLNSGIYGDLWIDWRYENDNELIQLHQFRDLFPNSRWNLHVPYLPYARQDKEIGNGEQTFGLHTFAKLINLLNCERVSAVDVHNPVVTQKLIRNFVNIPVSNIHHRLIASFYPDAIVFPDEGAVKRYKYLTEYPYIIFHKERDQSTGEIKGHKALSGCSGNKFIGSETARLMIIDDLCDGGKTFISVAHQLTTKLIGLFVTHGLFSKGRAVLEAENITLFTTNSLSKNIDGYEV